MSEKGSPTLHPPSDIFIRIGNARHEERRHDSLAAALSQSDDAQGRLGAAVAEHRGALEHAARFVDADAAAQALDSGVGIAMESAVWRSFDCNMKS